MRVPAEVHWRPRTAEIGFYGLLIRVCLLRRIRTRIRIDENSSPIYITYAVKDIHVNSWRTDDNASVTFIHKGT